MSAASSPVADFLKSNSPTLSAGDAKAIAEAFAIAYGEPIP
jgi:hypothetical protein